jgi:hypothetical protein
MVATSPQLLAQKLGIQRIGRKQGADLLTPARTEMLDAMKLEMVTVRLYDWEQLPHARYSLPEFCAQY